MIHGQIKIQDSVFIMPFSPWSIPAQTWQWSWTGGWHLSQPSSHVRNILCWRKKTYLLHTIFVPSQVPQLPWMSLPEASGLGNLTTLSPSGQRVKVGETVGGGVEKHQSVEGGCFLTKRQEKCFSSVEEDNLIRIINIEVPTPTWLIRLNSFSDLMMLLSNTFRLLLIFILDHLGWKAFSSEITIVLEEACNH